MHLVTKKYLNLFIVISSIVIGTILTSCTEDQWISENSTPKITLIQSNPTFFGDTITIYGENLGDIGLESYVVFLSSVKDTIIHSSKCLIWTVSKVKLIVPPIESNRIYLMCNGVKTDFLDITIDKLPNLATVEVSPGDLIMGSIFGLKDEMPVHNVHISNTLIVSKFEINQFYYNQVIGYNPSLVKDNRLPVDSVTWINAITFCNKLSVLSGLTPVYTIFGENVKWDTTANGWRLPTEAEWEYLCRAGDTNDYSGSNDLNKVGWYSMNSGLKSHPSGLKQPNSFGIYDMHGNVWEWCWDFYNSDYYTLSPSWNPKGPENGIRHIARGGAYDGGNSVCRASNRFYPSDPIWSTGIRIVRTKF